MDAIVVAVNAAQKTASILSSGKFREAVVNAMFPPLAGPCNKARRVLLAAITKVFPPDSRCDGWKVQSVTKNNAAFRSLVRVLVDA